MNLSDKEILNKIKTVVQEVIPDAKVYLFGSRARGDWHEESDWDILVLTKRKYLKETKQRLYDTFFSSYPEIAYWLQFVLATEEEWENAPQLYALHKLADPELITL